MTAAVVVVAAVPALAKAARSTTASTSTSVSCTPNPLHVTESEAAQCTATVTTGGGVPTGVVYIDLPNDYYDQLSSYSCTLVNGTCSVMLTPEMAGQPTVVASYQGDGTFPASSGSATITIVYATTMSLDCSLTAPSPTTYSCRAVYDSRSMSSRPSGSVSWATTGTGTFSNATSCAATYDNCTVTYTAPAKELATITTTFTSASPYFTNATAAESVRSGGVPTQVSKAPVDGGGALADWCQISGAWQCYLDLFDVGVSAYACVARVTRASDGAALPGEPVRFTGACSGTVTTDSNGVAAATNASRCSATYYVCGSAFTALFVGDDTYAPSAA